MLLWILGVLSNCLIILRWDNSEQTPLSQHFTNDLLAALEEPMDGPETGRIILNNNTRIENYYS